MKGDNINDPAPETGSAETGGPEPTQLRLLGEDATELLVTVPRAEKPVKRRRQTAPR